MQSNIVLDRTTFCFGAKKGGFCQNYLLERILLRVYMDIPRNSAIYFSLTRFASPGKCIRKLSYRSFGDNCRRSTKTWLIRRFTS